MGREKGATVNILILGASGQVGQALIAESKKRGWHWSGSCHEHAITPDLFRLDLADLDAVREAVRQHKPEVVFMPSGWTWVDGCERDPERAMLLNAKAPEAVAQECAELSAAMVYYSTEYVFGEHGGPFREDAPTQPLCVYGSSKLEGEQKVLAACPDALSLRTTVVYGPEPQGKNFIYQLIRNLAAGTAMTVPNDQLSSPTFNRDLARASVELVTGLEQGIWNVAGPKVLSRADFARLAAKVFGLNPDLLQGVDSISLAQVARRPLQAGLRIEKMERRLGWKPMDPEEALAAMKAELKDNGQWVRLTGHS